MSDRPKVSKPTALALLEPARFTRERTEDFVPTVIYAPRKGQPVISVLDAGQSLPEMLTTTLSQIRTRLGPAEWVAVTSDAYVARVESPEQFPSTPLAEAFAEGNPAIVEQMIVVLVDRYRGIEMASQTYRYTPVDGWEWDAPVAVTEHSSEVVRTIKHYL